LRFCWCLIILFPQAKAAAKGQFNIAWANGTWRDGLRARRDAAKLAYIDSGLEGSDFLPESSAWEIVPYKAFGIHEVEWKKYRNATLNIDEWSIMHPKDLVWPEVPCRFFLIVVVLVLLILLILFSHRDYMTQTAQLPPCTFLLLRDTQYSSANGLKGFGRFMRIFGHIPFMETNFITRPSTNHPLPPTSFTSTAFSVHQLMKELDGYESYDLFNTNSAPTAPALTIPCQILQSGKTGLHLPCCPFETMNVACPCWSSVASCQVPSKLNA